MICLTKAQVIYMHSMLIQQSGGLDGLSDVGLLDSSLNSAHATFDGADLYPTLEEKAARLAFNIVNNHPFIDGNKRIGLFVMLVFLELNGIELVYAQQELVELGLGLADGSLTYEDTLNWILSHEI